MHYIVGIDFDNTVVSYDDLFYDVAVLDGLVPREINKSKREIREYVRRLPAGEVHWQKLQGAVYGPKMRQARPVDGALAFVECCKKRQLSVYIISHKTNYATYDQTRTNLRDAAMAWMTDHRFFGVNGLGLSPNNVYFEATRLEKLQRIKSLGCTHFVDDLEETFLEPSFPTGVEGILYAPQRPAYLLPGINVASRWSEVHDFLFHAAK
jgi:hypothetical protein